MRSSPSCSQPVETSAFPALTRAALSTLQVNLGYRCNQSCSHCHVAAGPSRTESMDPDNLALVLRVLQERRIRCLDLTGGAPELHSGFRQLVRAARHLGVTVIDRCNLTILSEPGQEDLAAFLAEEQVQVVASLPCYRPDAVERQRGEGVFARSIAGLRRLNALGYGQSGSALQLHLVHNPAGAQLPPAQDSLERDYRRVLAEEQGVVFHQLYVLANMPIQRFAASLRLQGTHEAYLDLLRQAHRPENLAAVMCRSLISVDWQGHLHDCDFNQMLGLGLAAEALAERSGPRAHLRDLLDSDPAGDPIQVGDHCWGCTAGQGSSCSGSLHPLN
ncbi:MAG: arsenosugar biosynthesis radical SAM (seleno)protein ArsS [Cyanobium sp.]